MPTGLLNCSNTRKWLEHFSFIDGMRDYNGLTVPMFTSLKSKNSPENNKNFRRV